MQKDYSCLLEKDDFAKELYGLMVSASYHPVCIVEYRRKAFICKSNDIRITFDSNLSTSEGNLNLFDEHLQTYPVEFNGTCTMEVKYNHFLFSYIKDVIHSCDRLSLSNSKYCRCRYFGLGGE